IPLTAKNKESLWTARRGYEFWKSIGTSFYMAASKECAAVKSGYGEAVSKMEKAITLACQLGEYEVAGVLAASYIRFIIDVGRDFTAAVDSGEAFAPLAKSKDERIAGHLWMVIGDSLRCAGEFERGEVAYRESLAHWPEESGLERAEVQSILAITVDR